MSFDPFDTRIPIHEEDERQQALESDYPALALCRLESLKVAEAKKTLTEHMGGDLFGYVCDLESLLKDTRAQVRELLKKQDTAALLRVVR